MSRLANDDAGIAVPVLAVIVGVVFVAVLFFKFVDMVGLSSGERKLPPKSAKQHPRSGEASTAREVSSHDDVVSCDLRRGFGP